MLFSAYKLRPAGRGFRRRKVRTKHNKPPIDVNTGGLRTKCLFKNVSLWSTEIIQRKPKMSERLFLRCKIGFTGLFTPKYVFSLTEKRINCYAVTNLRSCLMVYMHVTSFPLNTYKIRPLDTFVVDLGFI